MKNMFNLCSTEQSCINIDITCYKIGTLRLGIILAFGILSRDILVQTFCLVTRLLTLGTFHHLTLWQGKIFGTEDVLTGGHQGTGTFQHGDFLASWTLQQQLTFGRNTHSRSQWRYIQGAKKSYCQNVPFARMYPC